MTLQRLRSALIEIPIERMFRKPMKRSTTKAERRCLHLEPAPIVGLRP
jgi:hypothetical protein